MIRETARLLIREYVPEDLEAMQAYCADPEVTRHLMWGPNTDAQTLSFIRLTQEYSQEVPRTKYEWAVTLQESGELIGGCCLYASGTNGEIGYTLRRDCWGKGYASEAAAVLLAFGFKELRLHRIYATCRPDNLGSAGVMQKLGMTREGRLRQHIRAKDRWMDSEQYSILAHEFEGGQSNV